MKQQSIIKYFIGGFTLTYKSLDLYLIFLLLTSPSILNSFIKSSGGIFMLIDLVWLITYASLLLSVPIFLVQKQQNKSLDYKEFVWVILRNIKRLILPGILVFILFTIFLMLIFTIVVLVLHPTGLEITTFFQSFGKGWRPAFIIFSFLISLFEFTPFFFSLENNGLLTSLRKSLITAFTNLQYISFITLISFAWYTLNSFFPKGSVWDLVRFLTGGYFAIFLTASSLLYYQRVIKGKV